MNIKWLPWATAGVGLIAVPILFWQPDAAGPLGFWLTALGVAIALAIYRRQDVDANAKHRELRRIITAVNTPFDEDESQAARDQVADGGQPGLDELERAFVDHARRLEGDAEYIEPEMVPLRSIADLVSFWEAQGESGRWTVGSLLGAYQRPGANTASTLAFRDSAGNLRTWRLSRGGRGKKTPTIRETTPS